MKNITVHLKLATCEQMAFMDNTMLVINLIMYRNKKEQAIIKHIVHTAFFSFILPSGGMEMLLPYLKCEN